jgi:hypothetical protein
MTDEIKTIRAYIGGGDHERARIGTANALAALVEMEQAHAALVAYSRRLEDQCLRLPPPPAQAERAEEKPSPAPPAQESARVCGKCGADPSDGEGCACQTAQPPPVCTGSGGLSTSYQTGAASFSSLPTHGTCGICGQTVEVDGFQCSKVHPYIPVPVQAQPHAAPKPEATVPQQETCPRCDKPLSHRLTPFAKDGVGCPICGAELSLSPAAVARAEGEAKPGEWVKLDPTQDEGSSPWLRILPYSWLQLGCRNDRVSLSPEAQAILRALLSPPDPRIAACERLATELEAEHDDTLLRAHSVAKRLRAALGKDAK